MLNSLLHLNAEDGAGCQLLSKHTKKKKVPPTTTHDNDVISKQEHVLQTDSNKRYQCY